MSALVEGAGFACGQRVSDDAGCRGTVRYCGPVATSKSASEVYVGVEWDDAARGKGDGSVVDKRGLETRYFTTAFPTAASFVKPAKLDVGSSFAAALRAKYVAMDAPLEAPGNMLTHGLANTKRGATKRIELVGELKTRARQQLDLCHVSTVMLRCAGIASVGPVQQPDLHLERLVHVDVQCNLLGDWDVVTRLAEALPALESFDVSGNRLGPFGDRKTMGGFGAHLHKLVANDVGLRDWADVSALVRALQPRLRMLHVAANELRGAAAVDCPGHALEFLDVAKTGLDDASVVTLLQSCPGLVELHASENVGLRAATFAAAPGASETPLVFGTVEALGLSGCGLEDWSLMDSLGAAFPRLQRMRFADNPVTKQLGASQSRAFVLARVASLRHLNGADVSAKERAEAEKRYVRFALADAHQAAAADAAASEGDGEAPTADAALRRRHPHASRLLVKYDISASAAAGSAQADGGSKALGASLVTITLRCVASSNADAPVATKKVPASTKVALLKRVCAKLFDLLPEDQILYYRLDAFDAPNYLDDDSATLASFGVADGIEIHVSEKLCPE
ncbi:hypothetical protein M885DRAFT_514727 [Pelagophyceae sp. CCMP2097]|nr:hypothetical protein M885DRAFT_514727 [Pelagophyceae sp. CCMP2097]